MYNHDMTGRINRKNIKVMEDSKYDFCLPFRSLGREGSDLKPIDKTIHVNSGNLFHRFSCTVVFGMFEVLM